MIDESQIEYLLNGERADADTLNRPLRQIVSAVNASVGAGSGLFNHAQLLGRNDDNAHPISAITGLQEALSGVRIKQQYESNPDTNAFTDDEKAKLTGIATGATKNRDDSENADKVHTHTWSEVTGKPSTFTPSSHTHSVSQVTGLGTAATRDVGTGSGNVMEVGAGGLLTKSSRTFSSPTSDNNSAGFYRGYKEGATTAEGWPVNLPYLDYTSVVIGNSALYTSVLFFNTRTAQAYLYCKREGVYDGWVELYHTGNMPETATRWPTWSEVTNKPSTFAPVRSTNTVDGGIKTRLSGTTLYMTNNGNDA